jgi:hypothetical protein
MGANVFLRAAGSTIADRHLMSQPQLSPCVNADLRSREAAMARKGLRAIAPRVT